MSSTIYASKDTIFDEDIWGEENTEKHKMYMTEPMPAFKKPVYELSDDEELHTSFEEAISDRLLAIHGRLSRLSEPALAIQGTERGTDVVFSTAASIRNTIATQVSAHTPATNYPQNVSRLAWKRMTTFACFAMMLLLFGFDLMGLLVLHMH